MLDADLAEIYGYETKVFNRQVKNNIERFPEEFRFQLTKTDMENCPRCKICTLDRPSQNNKRGSNIKYFPYAFTEQGIFQGCGQQDYDHCAVVTGRCVISIPSLFSIFPRV